MEILITSILFHINFTFFCLFEKNLSFSKKKRTGKTKKFDDKFPVTQDLFQVFCTTTFREGHRDVFYEELFYWIHATSMG